MKADNGGAENALSGVATEDLVRELTFRFRDEVLSAPVETGKAIEALLKNLEFIRGYGQLHTMPTSDQTAPLNGQTLNGANGHAALRLLAVAPNGSSPEKLDLEALSRNQRSRIREYWLLETMRKANRPCALNELTAEIDRRPGMDASSSAIVSHLHRLKNDQLIRQPGSGLYAITTDGLAHLPVLTRTLDGLI